MRGVEKGESLWTPRRSISRPDEIAYYLGYAPVDMGVDRRHTQAVLALARRRVNVLWALLRDGRCYELAPPGARAA
ncbi:hypothetical protein ABIE67_000442 [Streptomyces sp. V4I8]|uniref:hypothetical protein n=1 Tax=Streptomyces sp. V4I8 TaxID=3156469 RepID=UPI00351293DE